MNVTLLGAGTIGLSWALLLVSHGHRVTLCDPRPDLAEAVASLGLDEEARSRVRLEMDRTLAVGDADLVQESGPEDLTFKKQAVLDFAAHAGPDALYFSSSSAIPSSEYVADVPDEVAARVLVAHPFNPPHLMPLVEVVPNPRTAPSTVERAMDFFTGLRKEPVALSREIPGFVGNRLQKALWSEAFALVQDGIISVTDLDALMKNSLGLRWASVGVFEAAALGGGEGGMEGLMNLLRDSFATIDLKTPDWADGMRPLYAAADEAYGKPARPALAAERDRRQAAILALRGQRDDAIVSRTSR